MSNSSDYVSSQSVFLAMIANGGSFVKALGEAGLRADPDNRAKIRATWPELYEQYAKLAERHQEA